MKLTGTHQLKAPREKVWEALNDQEILRQCTPGCKQLTLAAGDESIVSNVSYDVLMDVGVGSIKGSYAGKIQITDQIPGAQCKLTVSASGSTGFLRAEGIVQLDDSGEGTLVDYFGQAQVGGTIAGVGQRVIEGVAKLLVGQFFKCFETTVLKGRSQESEASNQKPEVRSQKSE